MRIINVARGPLIVDEDLKQAIDDGKVAGAALDVFTTEPITDHPLFGYPNVVVTPHLGASHRRGAGPRRRPDRRAGRRRPHRRRRLHRREHPRGQRGGHGGARPVHPARAAAGQDRRRAGRPASSTIEVEYLGKIAERDTRLLTLAVLTGVFAGRTEEEVNLVNAPTLAEERGITVSETRETNARDYSDLVRVTLGRREGASGTTLGHQHRPHLLEAWGQRFNLQIDDPYLTLFQYSDVPGMVGRVGTSLGEKGVNINAAAVGREGTSDLAVMAVTTDAPVPDDVVAADRAVRRLRLAGGQHHAVGGGSAGAGGLARHVEPQPFAREKAATSRAISRIARDAASVSFHVATQVRSVVLADWPSAPLSPLRLSTRRRQASVGPAVAGEVGEHPAVGASRSRSIRASGAVAQWRNARTRPAAATCAARASRTPRAPSAPSATTSSVTRRSIASDSRAGSSQRGGFSSFSTPGAGDSRPRREPPVGCAAASAPSRPGTASNTNPNSTPRNTQTPPP